MYRLIEIRNETLVMGSDGNLIKIHWPGDDDSVVSKLAKETMGDEVARLVEMFEEADLRPTGVKYTLGTNHTTKDAD